jgi:hypothetical protein
MSEEEKGKVVFASTSWLQGKEEGRRGQLCFGVESV